MSEEKQLDIDMDEEARCITKKLGCTEELVDQYMEAEFEYLMAHGFIYVPDDNDTREVPPEFLEPKDLDIDDMVDYIVENTGMDLDFVNKIVDAEYEYEYEHGIAGEKSYSDED